MGKAGKARKRQKIERGVADVGESDGSGLGSGSGSEDDAGSDGVLGQKNVVATLQVLACLSQRLDLYESKAMKPVRVALFPLIEFQKNKFFEEAMMTTNLSNEEFHKLASSSTISRAVSVIRYFALREDEFASEQHKHIRKALHPLVVYTNKKISAAKRPSPNTASSTTSAQRPSILPTAEPGSNSLSNRISNCFRAGDHRGALLALEEMHRICTSASSTQLEKNAALPKLGSLQRWVRDCDVAALKLTATGNATANNTKTSAPGLTDEQLSETSALLLYAVLRVTNLLQQNATQGSTPATSAAVTPGALPVSSSTTSAGSSLMRMRLSMQQKRTAGGKPKPSPQADSPCFERAVMDHFPAFSVPPVYQPQDYLTAPVLTGLIEQGAAAATSRASEQATSPSSGSSSSSSGNTTASGCTCTIPPADVFYSKVRVVSHVPGPQRRPPTQHDLNIFYTAPGTIRYFDEASTLRAHCETCASCAASAQHSAETSRLVSALPAAVLPLPVRHDVPSVPGAMLLTGVLTPLECAQFVVAAERLGYAPDAVDGIDNVVWLADDSLLSPIYARVRGLLPQMLEGHALGGLNARLRLFRYYPGAVYRPHIDGAWPGSGLLADGSYTDDAFDAEQHSRLTFLVYLSDGFEGGTTTYFLAGDDSAEQGKEPSKDGKDQDGDSGSKVGHIEVRKVKPQLGAVLVFPHGSASGSLVHEGSAVLTGVKYVIRTDVLYSSQVVA